MKKIKYRSEKETEISKYYTNSSTKMCLNAVKIITAYKGSSRISNQKLVKMQKSFERRGKINLRPFERILFGTGIRIELPTGIELQIRGKDDITLKKGLFVVNSPNMLHTYEIEVILYNSTPHLIEVKMYEEIAQVVFNKILPVTLEKNI